MPFKSSDEIDKYFESETNDEPKTSNWDPWYRGESIDIRHESDGTGTIIGRGSDSHGDVNKDHLHYVNHDDGSRTVHRSDRTQGKDHYESTKEATTSGLDGFFDAVTDFLGFDK
jgi:hypothetical protein